MLSKIFNWTVGSFFRTIGRVIAFLIIGTIIAYILSSNDIRLKLPSILTMHVNASTVNYIYQDNYYSSANTPFTTNTNSGVHDSQRIPLTTGSSNFVNVYFNSSANQNGTGAIVPNNNQYNEFIFLVGFGNPQTTVDRSYTVQARFTNGTSFVGYTYCYFDGESNINVNQGNFNASVSTVYYNLHCPLLQNNTSGNYYLSMFRIGTGSQNQLEYMDIARGYIKSLKDNQNIVDGINNQTQQQQQQHQEVMNSTTTEAEEEASGFFEDFDTPDFGGLSSIITAPLNTIRSLLNSSCTNLVLPLPFVNEDLTLPCMNSIYTTNFGAFFTIYQTIVLALIAYRCIRSIFYDIHGFTNPNDDRIEVMDL